MIYFPIINKLNFFAVQFINLIFIFPISFFFHFVFMKVNQLFSISLPILTQVHLFNYLIFLLIFCFLINQTLINLSYFIAQCSLHWTWVINLWLLINPFLSHLIHFANLVFQGQNLITSTKLNFLNLEFQLIIINFIIPNLISLNPISLSYLLLLSSFISPISTITPFILSMNYLMISHQCFVF